MVRFPSPRLSRGMLGFAGLVVATGFVLALGGTPRALAKSGDEHLRYAKTYQAAVEEARARHTFILVSFHKDKWGGCINQHRSVLENDGFVKWANENIVVVVGHTQEDHPTEYEDDRGKKQPGCPLYRGLTCEEHRAIPRECMQPPEGMPAVKSTGRMPNTWLVSPSGEVTEVPAADQQSAGKIEDLVEEALKESGDHLTWGDYEDYLEDFGEFDKALEAGEWKDAHKALKKFEKDTKKVPEGMKAEIDKRVEALDAKVTEAFEEIKQGEDVKAAIKAASKLRYAVGSRLKRGYLPVVDKIKDWVKETKAASK